MNQAISIEVYDNLFYVTGEPGNPFSIEVYDNLLYVTTYKSHDIFTLSKLGPTNGSNTSSPVYIAQDLGRIGDVVVVQQFKQNTSYASEYCL